MKIKIIFLCVTTYVFSQELLNETFDNVSSFHTMGGSLYQTHLNIRQIQVSGEFLLGLLALIQLPPHQLIIGGQLNLALTIIRIVVITCIRPL